MPYFETGAVVLHEMPHVDESGRTGAPVISDVKPMVVVEDGPDVTALFIPAGTPTILARPTPRDRPKPWAPGEFELVESSWSRWNALFLMRPSDWHATWLRWQHGFLVRDLQLDLVVAPDRTWRWKDLADLERSVELGVISEPIAARARAEADAVIPRIEQALQPFDSTWLAWRPRRSWSIPTLGAHHAGQSVDWAGQVV